MSELPNVSTTANDADQYDRYRELSMASVVSLTLGVLSLVALALPPLMILSISGLLVGLGALRMISRRPNDVSGRGMASVGVGLSLATLVLSTSMTTYFYLTEVPEGYRRVSFSELQPDDSRPDLPVPPSALELDGKKVFIKGYMYPSDKNANLTRFVLVPDMGTCCFGGQPALTDMVEVTLVGSQRTRYNRRRRRLAGTLHVDQDLKPVSGLNGVYYQLDADQIK